MKRINVLHTIETSGPGGAENVLLALVKGLDPERFRSVVVLNDPGWLEDRLLESGADVVRVQWKHWWDLKLPHAMARIARERGIDLIHSHLPDQNFYSCLAGRLSRTPVIATYHGPVELKNAHSVRERIKLREVKKNARCVVVVCDFVRAMMREIGFDDAKLHRIYNGVATGRFRNVARGTLRRELKLPADALLVGTVGNIRGPKGQEYFIRAAKTIATSHPNVHFTICGDLHPVLAPPLFRLTEELGLQERLHFLGLRSDIPQVIADLDVFVLPSTSEGFPLVVLEAMASSRPVVATRSGGTQEIVDEGRTGFLVPIADSDAMAARVQDLLADPEMAAHLGQAARLRCERNYSMQTMVSGYEKLYRECLGAQSEEAPAARVMAAGED